MTGSLCYIHLELTQQHKTITLPLKMPQFSMENISLIQTFGVLKQFNTLLHTIGSLWAEAFVGGCLHVHTPCTASGPLWAEAFVGGCLHGHTPCTASGAPALTRAPCLAEGCAVSIHILSNSHTRIPACSLCPDPCQRCSSSSLWQLCCHKTGEGASMSEQKNLQKNPLGSWCKPHVLV